MMITTILQSVQTTRIPISSFSVIISAELIYSILIPYSLTDTSVGGLSTGKTFCLPNVVLVSS